MLISTICPCTSTSTKACGSIIPVIFPDDLEKKRNCPLAILNGQEREIVLKRGEKKRNYSRIESEKAHQTKKNHLLLSNKPVSLLFFNFHMEGSFSSDWSVEEINFIEKVLLGPNTFSKIKLFNKYKKKFPFSQQTITSFRLKLEELGKKKGIFHFTCKKNTSKALPSNEGEKVFPPVTLPLKMTDYSSLFLKKSPPSMGLKSSFLQNSFHFPDSCYPPSSPCFFEEEKIDPLFSPSVFLVNDENTEDSIFL